ncbi:porin family protein [Vibrio sp. JC009]|uniref:outer membrane beta-barrel protein n=1 Tax=Vibrio sp. JC009 TaxID=2912314 RepID=UPI0023AF58FA|nr:hypothetical protein [Vibrio sp. JC009]WED24299.1 porin family protein [Vibrio sp. JC009]
MKGKAFVFILNIMAAINATQASSSEKIFNIGLGGGNAGIKSYKDKIYNDNLDEHYASEISLTYITDSTLYASLGASYHKPIGTFMSDNVLQVEDNEGELTGAFGLRATIGKYFALAENASGRHLFNVGVGASLIRLDINSVDDSYDSALAFEVGYRFVFNDGVGAGFSITQLENDYDSFTFGTFNFSYSF